MSTGTFSSSNKNEVKKRVNLLEYAKSRGLQPHKGHNRFPCPWREGSDSDGFAISPDGWYDHVQDEGGDCFEFVQRLDGVSFQGALSTLAAYVGIDMNPESKQSRHVVATYDYVDETGSLLYQVVKYEPKDFRQRKPDPDNPDQWIWKKSKRQVPYRLPDVLKADFVVITGGEKDADNVAKQTEFAATCNAGGEGKWDKQLTPYFQDKTVVVLGDNDNKGQKHLDVVAQALDGTAASVKTAVPCDDHKGADVSDLLAQQDGPEQLKRLIDQASQYEPALKEENDEKLAIQLNANWLTVIRGIIEAVNPYREIFIRSGEVVRLTNDAGAHFEPMTSAGSCSEFERFCTFYNETKDGDREFTRLHENVTRVILQAPETARNLPEVCSIADYPMPIKRHDRVFLTPSGYDPDTGIYTDPAGPVPEKMDLQAALQVITELLGDFCFAELNGDEGAHYGRNALVYLLTCHCRLLFEPERAPIFYAGGNRPGVGKDYLLGLGPLLITGRYPEYFSPTPTADETRKRILSLCRSGSRFLLVSNAKGHLSDESLEEAATSPVRRDRVLGKSEELTFPNRAIYAISGNGLTYSEDLARRLVPVELAFYGENTEDRTYHHPNLYEHVQKHRGHYLGALQTMVQTWIDAGCPSGSQRKNSFGKWSETIGGILETCGLPNPINADPLNAVPNEETEHFTKLLSQAFEKHGDVEIKKPELQQIAIENELFGWMGDLENERKAKTRFGKMIGRMERRRFDGLYLVIDRTVARPTYQIRKEA